jgi:putative ABC transport system permease protein
MTAQLVHVWRSLQRDRATVTVAVLSLALAIATSAAIFTVARSVLWQPLPFRDAERLVHVWETLPENDHWTVAPAVYEIWQRDARSIEDLAGYNIWFPTLTGDGPAARLTGSVVTAGFFRMLGVAPVLGRGLQPSDYATGAAPVVVISDAIWRTRFGAQRAALGASLRLDGVEHEIVGVLPSGFRHPERRYTRADVWKPERFERAGNPGTGRYLRVLGRLREGTPLAAAQAEFGALSARVAAAYPATHAQSGARVVPLRIELFGTAKPVVSLLLAAAGLVLLIVAANTANLMLARSTGRTREFAVRAALGAAPATIARQVLLEAVLIALLGGALGMVALVLASGALAQLINQHIAAFAQPTLDAAVLLFTAVVCMLTAFAFGALPAARAARVDVRAPLAAGSRSLGGTAATRRARESLIIAELALTTALLVSAGLLGRSFLLLTTQDIGLDPEGVATVSVVLPADASEDKAIRRQQVGLMLDRIRAEPDVEAAAVASDLPFTQWNMFTTVRDDDVVDAIELEVEFHRVSEDFFGVMRIPLRGGTVLPGAKRGGRQGAVVSRALAERLWPGQDPVGRFLVMGTADARRELVVNGVAGDVLDNGFGEVIEPRMYLPFDDAPGSNIVLVARTPRPEQLLLRIRRIVESTTVDAPVTEALTMSGVVGATVAARRIVLFAGLAFSALALVLAAAGIHGIMTYSVNQRRPEMGVRKALGARSGDLVRMVLGNALRITASGVAGGLLLAAWAAALLQHQLYGVRMHDPVVFVSTALTLAAVAVLSSWLPARRAGRVDAITTLHAE